MTRQIRQLIPAERTVDLNELLSEFSGSPVARPFDQSRLDFVADLSRELSRRGRGFPETQSLAFWMRRAELSRMQRDFTGSRRPDVLVMPRGTAFHLPPANVDTMFVYSLVLSLLMGNRNIVRLSTRATDQSNLILAALNDVLDSHTEVGRSLLMVTYGHEDEITAAISAECDIRVIWGGDDTVNRIRQIPLPPHAIELPFPDRFSMAVIGTDSYRSLSDQGRDHVAEMFFNDSYWFDQLGCSSPRLLIWIGPSPSDELAKDFHARLLEIIERKEYFVDTSSAIAKISQSMRTMIDADVAGHTRYDNALTVLSMSDFPDVRGDFCGSGFFYQLVLDSLEGLVPHIRRADQTLAFYGVPRADLEQFASNLVGRGIDRMVPFGKALQFSRVWDGYDLLEQFSRKVVIEDVTADMRG